MKVNTLVTLLFMLHWAAFSQSQTTKRSGIFLEIAGSGGLGSINYERDFWQTKNTMFLWRAGFSVAPIDKNNGMGLVFPLMIHTSTGKSAHKLECGLGQGITVTTKGNFFILTTASFGYRFQPADKHFYYRVTYTPLISYLFDFQVQHWGGISIGYSFFNK
ncbi:MAG: hypothetical protein IPM74_10225 [Crocinitomicaceae bacterium]|nr:hypothetical protein [Crocinitomicaceae bacterium]MBK8926268.1 hypothetical protein [Crocinitomicaceae bacterium]